MTETIESSNPMEGPCAIDAVNPALGAARAEYVLAASSLEFRSESIRWWVLKFGPVIAKNLRGTRPKPHSRWHLDEMVVSIAGRQMYLWRAVDSEGEVLEILVQPNATKPRRCGCYGNSFDVRASFLR